jgi:hypothetical protein
MNIAVSVKPPKLAEEVVTLKGVAGTARFHAD